MPKSNSFSRQYAYENPCDTWLKLMHFQLANQNGFFLSPAKNLHNIAIW